MGLIEVFVTLSNKKSITLSLVSLDQVDEEKKVSEHYYKRHEVNVAW